MTIKQIILLGPQYSTWEGWNASLVHYFGEEPIPYIPDENFWQEVANNVVQLPTFAPYYPPDPYQYEKWQEWVDDFIIAVNGLTN